mmetsp:Transcript_27009/g.46065  ORF Transcript_27009/g.46065 Transcript_27009/m.46065 type:complete len:646 (-) Transcript_27009:335-2272(-)
MSDKRALSEVFSQSLGTGELRHSGVVLHRSNRAALAVVNNGNNDASHTDVSITVADGGSEPKKQALDKSCNGDDKYQEMIKLPQSTHSLLFTENVLSAPFAFAFSVLSVSIGCLVLAFYDNLNMEGPNSLNIPANVPPEVRAAQYLSILIAVTMEEEIPTATRLLRMIPKSSVEAMGISYGKFLISAACRLAIGYFFLINVFLVIAQSDRVLDIFYDMLALNFVSMIDDIAFQLAKYDVMGKRLRIAATAKYFRAEFERKPYLFRKKMTIFVKLLYAFNLLVFFGGMIYISVLQGQGTFQCNSIQVTFGEDIWENAWVHTPDGQVKSQILIYSFFNGVYEQTGVYAGRPVYKELRKSEASHFDTQSGAEIKYCPEEKAWVFTHEYIKKTNTSLQSSCPWLLRSPDTLSYDLMDVTGEWQIWVGVINHNAKMDATCNGCETDTDCNLNGVCTIDQRCDCGDSQYYGLHCELERPCSRIRGNYNDTWSMLFNRQCGYLQEYGRPVYSLENIGDAQKIIKHKMKYLNDDDIFNLIYQGSRWFAVRLPGGKHLEIEDIEHKSREFHAFWEDMHGSDVIAVSDPVSRSYPVGVDFYSIGETGDQFGPFGVLYPLQEPPGHGAFRCDSDSNNSEEGYSHFFRHCGKNSTNT